MPKALKSFAKNKPTDLLKWRLSVDKGRQTWRYLETKQELQQAPSQSFIEKYWLGLTRGDEEDEVAGKSSIEAARSGLRFFKQLQCDDGHWAGEYGGPLFLIPGLVIVMYITGSAFPSGQREELVRYLHSCVNEDGGWGIHIEGESTVFGTVLNYVSLRLLGEDAETSECVKARGVIHKLGGATGIPAWGKFWLACLSCYEWEGMNPFPTELWLLPDFVPIHPGKMWVHSRQVYLSMGWLYCEKFKYPKDSLVEELRAEIYVEDYESIQWSAQRNNIAAVDLYCPHTYIHDFVFGMLSIYEKSPIQYFRKKSQAFVLDQIRAEDKNTSFACLGPVNKMMNMLVCFVVDGKSSAEFARHLERNQDFLWMGGDGLRMNGTNGSQLWDTAFACQAIIESGLANEEEFKDILEKALGFMDVCQITENMPKYEKYYRHISKGAWPFSTKTQSYTVSDCTAEGLKTVCLLQELPYTSKVISDSRLFDAVNVLLSMQNADGGFASYELVRGPRWFELFNSAEVFGNIMIEYTYPECTTSVILGLSTFQKRYPEHRVEEINATIAKAIGYIKNQQRPDGSWFGSWAICFTYATYFALESLSSLGLYYHNSNMVKRACDFLVSKQMECGGWGEKYRACEIGEWVNHEKSQVVNTSWVCLSLLAAKYPLKEPIKRGIELIKSRQKKSGEWVQENIEGVFNKNCMISYPNYKFYFCIWALGRYNNVYHE